MSRSMQDKILKHIEGIAATRGLEMVVDSTYANVLTILFQPKKSFGTALEAHLQFNVTYLHGKVKANGKEAEILKTDYNNEREMSTFFHHFHQGGIR